MPSMISTLVTRATAPAKPRNPEEALHALACYRESLNTARRRLAELPVDEGAYGPAPGSGRPAWRERGVLLTAVASAVAGVIIVSSGLVMVVVMARMAWQRHYIAVDLRLPAAAVAVGVVAMLLESAGMRRQPQWRRLRAQRRRLVKDAAFAEAAIVGARRYLDDLGSSIAREVAR